MRCIYYFLSVLQTVICVIVSVICVIVSECDINRQWSVEKHAQYVTVYDHLTGLVLFCFSGSGRLVQDITVLTNQFQAKSGELSSVAT